DDEDVIAGQGTIGLEILEEMADVDAVVVPVGGGGLISGVGFAVKGLNPYVKGYGVQAAGAPSMERAAHEHQQLTLARGSPVADGGLISGVAFAVKALNPSVNVYGVQAAGAPSMERAVHEHQQLTLESVSTFADGIAVKHPGDITFQMCQQYVGEIVTVSDDE